MPDLPTQQPPPVQKLRVRYAKRGRMRFTSHRDFARALERAVARAQLPVAYSSGFHPHPRISYAGASPTGAATEAEYCEIGFAQAVGPMQVQPALDDALPQGLDIVDVVVAGPGALADRLEASAWQIQLTEVAPAEVAAAVERFLAEGVVEVERMTKRGARRLDCREAVVSMSTRAGVGKLESCAILEVVVRQEVPAVRPDDILAGFRAIAGLVVPVPPMQIRLAQGPLDPRTGNVGDPLDPDRDGPSQVPTAERTSMAGHVSGDAADASAEC
ncbi:MAG: TIGR03936 family radical SAM-associated protein [Nocardioidaceae bacterium]